MDTKLFFTKKRNIVLLAILCTLLWGSAYPGVKTGYELFAIETSDIYGKIAFAGYRFTLSGILVLIFHYLVYKKIEIPTKVQLPRVFFLGLMVTSLQYSLFYVGLANTTGINGAILNGTGTFFSVLLAHFIYADDRLNLRKALGTAVGFSGVVLINLAGNPDAPLQINYLGDGLLILAALMSAIGFIYSKKLSQSINSVTLTGFQLLFGGSVLVMIALANGTPFGASPPPPLYCSCICPF
ncbi:DMT family transporter [Alkalibacter rhizosphaerae]|uniref:DMT family transporter n=1 Tax=Alkalibacter rhizosphaerae TaxID=2815577 RepID=UPI00403DC5A6